MVFVVGVLCAIQPHVFVGVVDHHIRVENLRKSVITKVLCFRGLFFLEIGGVFFGVYFFLRFLVLISGVKKTIGVFRGLCFRK